MKCFSGIFIKSTGMTVPCGQCMPCRINKGRKWTTRLILEAAYSDGPHWFWTLTYAEAPTVDGTSEGHQTLKKKQFLKYLDNWKTHHDPLRYFAVGEYGDQTGRPHYHMVTFGQTHSQRDRFQAAWSKRFGFANVSEAKEKRLRYICQYTTKKLTKATDQRLPEGVEPEFRTSTRNPPIGAAALPALLAPYHTAAGKRLLEQRGDVERAIMLERKIYPLDGWLLTKMRTALGIPLLHRERILAHPAYLDWHMAQEAECDPELAIRWENRINAKAKIRKQITDRV